MLSDRGQLRQLTRLKNCQLSCHSDFKVAWKCLKAADFSSCMGTHAYSSRTLERETGQSRDQSQPLLCSQFEASLHNRKRYLKNADFEALAMKPSGKDLIVCLSKPSRRLSET